ncbi:MAG: manganese efflux pump MntP family protein [Clostridiales bacterium]
MAILQLILISVGLAMDAFAVSVCKGLSMDKIRPKNALIIGAYFGLFQGGMPIIGYFLGVQFQDKITAIDHWIAFVLLVLIGANMIREAMSKEDVKPNDSVDFKTMIVLAVATSIDALAIGVTFAFLQVNIITAASLIAIVTFIISLLGVKIGNVFGTKYKSKAEFVGGLILILLGTKILIEHLGLF